MKEYKIICPYCFKEFDHTDVHFRSEKVNTGEYEDLPAGFLDIDAVKARYRGNDRDAVLARYEDWAFFQEGEDTQYERFWNDRDEGYGGTSEQDPAGEKLGVLAYRRKVINPRDPMHQKYLKKQSDEGYLIYDQEGFATNIEIGTGESCNRRVCPHCHNPLPGRYGKYPVKFTTVIGITGAGKTVYMSQLIKRASAYAAKVGMAAITSNVSARTFLQTNVVKERFPLPGSTPPNTLLQPVIYDMVTNPTPTTRETQTLVLYDVAGENCVDADLMHRFGRFIEHADGIFLLIDPMQFDAINAMKAEVDAASSPTEVLTAIHNLVVKGERRKCEIPLAICVSKSDMDEVQDVLDTDLCANLMEEVESIRDASGLGKTLFNASQFNPIARSLRQFVLDNEVTLEQLLHTNYSAYNYFAFTSLGCEVENGAPVGPLLPKRIEEPLLWMCYKFGYIGADCPVYEPGEPDIKCPDCGSVSVSELPEEEREITVKTGFLRKKKIYVTHKCNACGEKFCVPGK